MYSTENGRFSNQIIYVHSKSFSKNVHPIFSGAQEGGESINFYHWQTNKVFLSIDRRGTKKGGAINSRPCGAIGRRGIGPRAGAGSYVLYMLGSVRLGLICRRLKHRLEGIFMAPQGTVLNRSITIPHVKFLVRL